MEIPKEGGDNICKEFAKLPLKNGSINEFYVQPTE